jgi:hypothetical protein
VSVRGGCRESSNVPDALVTALDDLVDVDVSRKVLKGVRVERGKGGVGLGELDRAGETRGVVVDGAIGNLGDVEETVEEVDGPVGGGSGGGERVALHAHLDVVPPVRVRCVADNRLRGGVVAAPVTPPSRELAVLDISWTLKNADERLRG